MGKILRWLNDQRMITKLLLSHLGLVVIFSLIIFLLLKIFPSFSLPVDLLIAFIISLLVSVLFVVLLKHSLVNHVDALTNQVRVLSSGKIVDGDSLKVQSRQDEIGSLINAFSDLMLYLRNFHTKLSTAARGNLSVIHEPVADQDTFGTLLKKMITEMHEFIHQTSLKAVELDQLSNGIRETAASSDLLVNQLVEEIDRIASETNEQMAAIGQGVHSVERVQKAVKTVFNSLKDQMVSIHQGGQISGRLAETINHVSENIYEVAQETNAAETIVQTGVEKIGVTFKNIQGVRDLVELSQEKVVAMQSQTGKISKIVETIEDIAAQTNLLAINATIEAAHAEADSKVLTEAMLEKFMYAACEMVARLLETSDDIPDSYWVELGKMAEIDQILITDEDGVIVIGNDPSLLGFRFPEDNPQTAEFRTLIHQKNGRVCQPAQMRAADRQVFKYAGISRRDKPGIVQVGYNMNSLALFNFQIGGFAVVAREVYNLAESSRTATKEIRQLLKAIQDAANEAKGVMENSVGSVKTSLSEAVNAGNTLNEIMAAIKHVSEQTNLVAGTTEEIKGISAEFQHSIQSLQQLIETNNEVVENLARDTDSVSGVMDQLISACQNNHASMKSTMQYSKNIKTKMRTLNEDSQKLQSLVFTLGKTVETLSLDKK